MLGWLHALLSLVAAPHAGLLLAGRDLCSCVMRASCVHRWRVSHAEAGSRSGTHGNQDPESGSLDVRCGQTLLLLKQTLYLYTLI